MTQEKAKARSIGDRLSAIAKKRGASYQDILTEFLIERMLVRLIGTENLKNRLVFKGGFVSLRAYASPRYTVDLDASLRRGTLKSIADITKIAVETELQDGAWFKFESSRDLETQGKYGGLRLIFRSGVGAVLKNVKKAQIINLDIGTGDPITPEPTVITTPQILGSESLTWSVYPVETTVAEKLHCLVTRHLDNSRSKDIFDLNILLPLCNPIILQTAITATFSFREDPVPKNLIAHLQQIDTTILRRGWNSAVTGIKPIPDFDKTLSQFIAALEKIQPKRQKPE